MDYDIILKPLVGAVIGYSTNWLAIKMLFRPHEEKKLGSMRIPFTPGVIPRERDRIARSLGTAVGEQLLTEEVIANELLNDKVTDHIKAYIVDELLVEDQSLDTLIKAVFKDDSDKLIEDISTAIIEEIKSRFHDPSFNTTMRSEIAVRMAEEIPYEGLIGNVVDQSTAAQVQTSVRDHMAVINGYIIDIASGEAIKTRLAQAIEKLVMEKVGALGAMFLDGPAMADSVVDYLDGLLKEEEVQEGMIALVGDGVERLRSKNVSEVFSLEAYTNLINDITNKLVVGVEAFVMTERLSEILRPMISAFFHKKIHLTQDQKAKIEGQVEVLYKQFIDKNITTFLDSFDVSQIVEDEINRFSVMDIEKLIFGIIDKELKTITWLGGVLGAIIGLVYVVL